MILLCYVHEVQGQYSKKQISISAHNVDMGLHHLVLGPEIVIHFLVPIVTDIPTVRICIVSTHENRAGN